jgi:hypothetical protein
MSLPKKVKKSKNRDWQGEIYTPHGHNFILAPLAPQTFDKLRPSFGGNRSLFMVFKVPQNWGI